MTLSRALGLAESESCQSTCLIAEGEQLLVQQLHAYVLNFC